MRTFHLENNEIGHKIESEFVGVLSVRNLRKQ